MLRRTTSEHRKRYAPFTRRRRKNGGRSSRRPAPSRNECDRSRVKRQIKRSISAIGRLCYLLIYEIISSPILLMCSWSLEDRKWVWKLDTKGVAKDAHHHAVYQDERKHPINNRH